MPRLLFEKMGTAVWMSHLDLMRVFQRAFKRAGLPLTHTKGFNPRPSVSIALPLSVGVESVCELLDFDLEGESVPMEEIRDRLNGALVPGVFVRECCENGRKLRDLSLLRCRVSLEYDAGIPEGAEGAIRDLFAGESIPVEKKGKNGTVEQDIRPMIRSMDVASAAPGELMLDAVICCQNPTLNPALLVGAVCRYLPEFAPNHSRIARKEIFDNTQTVFR